MRYVSITVLVIAALFGVAWVGTANNWALMKVFAPKIEQVRYDTFKQSQSYNDGMAQQVEDVHAQYVTATADQRAMLATDLLHRLSDYDTSKLSPDDQQFIACLRSDRDSPLSSGEMK